MTSIYFDGCILPSGAGTISGSTNVCAGTDGLVYSIAPLQNTTTYNWTLPAGFNIAGGVYSSTIYVNATAGASSGNITVSGSNACGSGTPATLPVTVFTRPTPSITGPSIVCAGTGGQVYTTQAGMSSYQWTTSTGGVIQSGSSTNTVSVRWDSAGARTISVNYANAPGCFAVSPASYNVNVLARPVPSINGPDSVCAGTAGHVYTTDPGMTGYTWTVSPGGVVTGGGTTTSNTVTITWTSAGTKSVSVSYINASGCTPAVPSALSVLVSPIPVPQVFGPNAVCIQSTNQVYSTQTGMSGYTWSVSSGGTITSTNDSSAILVSWNTTGNQYVTVNYSSPAGCSAANPDTLHLVGNPRPLPTITGPVTACKGTGGNIYTTETGKSNYQWSVSSGGTIQSGTSTNTVSVQWDSVGSRTISVNYTNAQGCSGLIPVSSSVMVYPRPIPTISGPDSVCVTSNGNTYSTQSGMTNYVWSISPGGLVTAGGTTTSNFITVTWTTTGNKTVSVSYTNANGCSPVSATVLPVYVNVLPVPQIFGPTTACALSTGHVYTTLQGMASYSWSVSPGGVITSPTDTSAIQVSWNTTGSHYVTVNCTTVAGCTAAIPDTLQVTVNPRPAPTISGPVSVCEATGGHIYSTEPMNTGYQWTLSGGGTIIAGLGTSLITLTWDTAGARQVMVNYTSPSTGCNALTPTSYAVTVKPKPTPSITGPTPVCKGISGNTYTTQNGMLNYIWNVSSGNTTTSGGTTGSNFITVTWNVVDTQTVSVNYTATNGCTSQTAATYKVNVNPLPTPTIGGPDTVCVNTTMNLYGTQPGMFSYTWATSTGGTISSGSGTDTIAVNWTQSGAQWVSINYNDSNGCTAAAPVVYNVHILTLPVPVITGPASACMGSVGNTYTTASGMTNYQWVVSNGGTSTAGGSDSVNYVTVTWDSAGAQTVSAGYTNPTGCSSAPLSVYNVTVQPLPAPTITGETGACVDGGNYTYSTETGMTGYVWTASPSGQIISGQGSPQVQINWLATGSQWVGVNYTNANGCTAAVATTLTVTVDGVPGQMGAVTGIDTICGVATGISYTTYAIANANAYNWTVPPGAIITSGAGTTNILVDFPATALSGNVTVTASNACGNGAPSPPLEVTVTQIPDAPEIHLEGDMLISNMSNGNQWFKDGTKIPGATGSTYLVVEEGEYWDNVIINSCESDTSNHIYVIITGIKEGQQGNITLYPNPNDGIFTLSFDQKNAESYEIVVVNQLGLKVTEKRLQVKQGYTLHQIDLRPLPIGIYTILVSGETTRVVKKIIVN